LYYFIEDFCRFQVTNQLKASGEIDIEKLASEIALITGNIADVSGAGGQKYGVALIDKPLHQVFKKGEIIGDRRYDK
jgi:hypothetical protein